MKAIESGDKNIDYKDVNHEIWIELRSSKDDDGQLADFFLSVSNSFN